MSRPWEEFTNQDQWKQYLQHLLRTNKRALYRAIVLIADRQTPEEKVMGMTIDNNGVGFGAIDAELFTGLALRIKNGGELTERELAMSRNKMPKYWRQLMIISKRRMENEKSKVCTNTTTVGNHDSSSIPDEGTVGGAGDTEGGHDQDQSPSVYPAGQSQETQGAGGVSGI